MKNKIPPVIPALIKIRTKNRRDFGVAVNGVRTIRNGLTLLNNGRILWLRL